MSLVFVDTAALRAAAAGTRAVGADIAAHALSGRADAAALAPAFGIIGAEFAAAAAMVTDRHCRDIEQLSARISAAADSLDKADPIYADTDDGSAAQITAT
jgi:hypothetical protein